MDTQATRDLVKASRAPLGQVGQIVLARYVEDFREQAQTTMLVKDVVPMQPTWRCKYTDGRGRCRGRVTEAAVIQHCVRRHQFTRIGDSNLEALLLCRRDCPNMFFMARLDQR